jgi:hypothetical protein
MTEKDHEPAGLDQGIDAKGYPEIWFEQVLQHHVTPTIVGMRPRHVPLSQSTVAVVIDVPARKGDPHQVSDGRYHRRHNFNRLIMEHYEIRDAIRRVLEPALQLEFEIFKGDAAYKNIEFSTYRDVSDPVAVGAILSNTSNQPPSRAAWSGSCREKDCLNEWWLTQTALLRHPAAPVFFRSEPWPKAMWRQCACGKTTR